VLARPRTKAVGFWVPFEAMHAMARLHLVVADAPALYGAPLAASWRFFRERMTDDEAPGFWDELDDRGRPLEHKSGDWIATYHAARALVVTADALTAPRSSR
jgi:mannose/cellobiose epimerase-like protein (N-acyl-D-glucosamine 2-epimerase family)